MNISKLTGQELMDYAENYYGEKIDWRSTYIDRPRLEIIVSEIASEILKK